MTDTQEKVVALFPDRMTVDESPQDALYRKLVAIRDAIEGLEATPSDVMLSMRLQDTFSNEEYGITRCLGHLRDRLDAVRVKLSYRRK